MHIYVIVHESFDDTNEFYFTYEQAQNRLLDIYKETETQLNEWKICTLTEGKPFGALIYDYISDEEL